jgi:hypothetical protein
MNRITVLSVIVIIALSFSLGAMQSRAQEKTNFAGIIPFVTSNNRVGFFDQKTGLIYMYDDNISQCTFIGQLSQLGQPVQIIKNENSPTTSTTPALPGNVRTW